MKSKFFSRTNFRYLKIIKILFLFSIYLLYILNNTNSFRINLKKVNYFEQNTYRIAFVFGTRAEAMKLFPIVKELRENKNFSCITINIGLHKEVIQEIFYYFNINNSIDFNLDLMNKNQSLSKLAINALLELKKIYTLVNPNAVIVQGDTNSGLAAAICALYQNVPIFHVDAGLRTHKYYFNFLEEFNGIIIDDISTLYFSSTELGANNLLKEKKNASNIYITGNTIVDSLQIYFNNAIPSIKIKSLIKQAKLLCTSKDTCKIILLTYQGRENYHKPILNILKAIQVLLKNFNDIVIIFPFHLNSNVKKSIKAAIPNNIYKYFINRKKINDKKYIHLNRFLMISPLNYFDLLFLELESYFIMTDSDSIQEEAISIGKPLLILNENTQRLEAVKSGSAFLSGTSSNNIYNYSNLILRKKELYKKIARSKNIYGNGSSRIIISQIIQNYFKNKKQNSSSSIIPNYADILYNYDNSVLKNINSNCNNNQFRNYDIVIVLTVWKRNNLEKQLNLVKNQTILKNKKTNIIIFQNSNHIDVQKIVDKWKNSNSFSGKININFIQSPFDTGYFGRFIIPLTSSVSDNSYFFICDDDVIWGNRYFENMLRVVDEGALATRAGRTIDKDYIEISQAYNAWEKDIQVCFNEDIEYDFGIHIWAGRISWLRKAWNHIPISLENCEDFWISAALKSFYNIPTKTPKCPCPNGDPIIPDMCAASDKSAIIHENAIVGKLTYSHNIRNEIRRETSKTFNYKRLMCNKPNYVKNIHKKFVYGNMDKPLFNLSDPLWKDVLFWQ